MKCERHKRYRAKSKPTSACDECWTMWLYNEVKAARETTLPNTMTEEYLYKAVRNHRCIIERCLS